MESLIREDVTAKQSATALVQKYLRNRKKIEDKRKSQAGKIDLRELGIVK